jgi:hypothetical protein
MHLIQLQKIEPHPFVPAARGHQGKYPAPNQHASEAYMLNEILNDLDSSPFQPPKEFCVKLSQKFGREVRPDEITAAMLTSILCEGVHDEMQYNSNRS